MRSNGRLVLKGEGEVKVCDLSTGKSEEMTSMPPDAPFDVSQDFSKMMEPVAIDLSVHVLGTLAVGMEGKNVHFLELTSGV